MRQVQKIIILGIIGVVIVLIVVRRKQSVADKDREDLTVATPITPIMPITPVTPPKPFELIGCFRDDHIAGSAMQVAEGSDPVLDGNNYQLRVDAIQKCFTAAKNKGHRIFALQHSGWCGTAPNDTTYARYGPANACVNGKGGPNANDVYRIAGM